MMTWNGTRTRKSGAVLTLLLGVVLAALLLIPARTEAGTGTDGGALTINVVGPVELNQEFDVLINLAPTGTSPMLPAALSSFSFVLEFDDTQLELITQADGHDAELDGFLLDDGNLGIIEFTALTVVASADDRLRIVGLLAIGAAPAVEANPGDGLTGTLARVRFKAISPTGTTLSLGQPADVELGDANDDIFMPLTVGTGTVTVTDPDTTPPTLVAPNALTVVENVPSSGPCTAADVNAANGTRSVGAFLGVSGFTAEATASDSQDPNPTVTVSLIDSESQTVTVDVNLMLVPGVYTATFVAADGVPNTSPPMVVLLTVLDAEADPDMDGFNSGPEAYFGTDPLVRCGKDFSGGEDVTTAWPVDHDGDDAVGLSDLLDWRDALLAVISGGSPDLRFDLDESGGIGVSDASLVIDFFGDSRCA